MVAAVSVDGRYRKEYGIQGVILTDALTVMNSNTRESLFALQGVEPLVGHVTDERIGVEPVLVLQ